MEKGPKKEINQKSKGVKFKKPIKRSDFDRDKVIFMINEFVNNWQKLNEKRSKKEYRDNLVKILDDIGLDPYFTEREDIDRWLESRSNHVKETTIDQELTKLNSFFKYLCSISYIKDNPCLFLKWRNKKALRKKKNT